MRNAKWQTGEENISQGGKQITTSTSPSVYKSPLGIKNILK